MIFSAFTKAKQADWSMSRNKIKKPRSGIRTRLFLSLKLLV